VAERDKGLTHEMVS